MNMLMNRPYIGMAKERKYKCCICNTKHYNYGHNPFPISNIGLKERCCDKCNELYVISSRYAIIDNKITLSTFGSAWKAKDFIKKYDIYKGDCYV
ncbi:hypothetical protein [Arcobacter peruensis]|uniref:hypothetical protein n=1 Tax=Arcobacter peruensis TaxID=2320140 RepID=UPI000F0732D9|nr:hypothetical protein [Arcobacter peruensis]